MIIAAPARGAGRAGAPQRRPQPLTWTRSVTPRSTRSTAIARVSRVVRAQCGAPTQALTSAQPDRSSTTRPVARSSGSPDAPPGTISPRHGVMITGPSPASRHTAAVCDASQQTQRNQDRRGARHRPQWWPVRLFARRGRRRQRCSRRTARAPAGSASAPRPPRRPGALPRAVQDLPAGGGVGDVAEVERQLAHVAAAVVQGEEEPPRQVSQLRLGAEGSIQLARSCPADQPVPRRARSAGKPRCSVPGRGSAEGSSPRLAIPSTRALGTGSGSPRIWRLARVVSWTSPLP